MIWQFFAYLLKKNSEELLILCYHCEDKRSEDVAILSYTELAEM